MFEWVTYKQVLSIHQTLIEQTGGLKGTRDTNLLESALSRPLNSVLYADPVDVFEIATEYAYGIIRNHPFIDGNKRTAFAVTAVFLSLNNYELNQEKKDEQETLIQKFANGEVSKTVFADFLRKNAKLINQEPDIKAVNFTPDKANKKPRLR